MLNAMSVDLDWFKELLGALGPISVRRMFGGAGFYTEGRMIALEAFGSLYLKTDDETRARFAEAGGSPFVYDGKGKPIVMSYWTAPDEAMDSAEAMRAWAKLALEAALRAGPAKTVGAQRKAEKAAKRVSNKATPKKAALKKTTSEKAVAKNAVRKNLASKKVAAKKIAAKKTTKK
jgi:DNA transformation protein and related proteins